MTRVAIVGLGLLGGSIALALREARPSTLIIGVDRASVLQSADARRIADELFEIDELPRALAGADLAVLSAPALVIADQVALALEHARIVTDCGSTKRVIAARAALAPRRAYFVPGHPMAGGPEGGAERARPDLFRAKRWLLCPEGVDPEALASVEDLVRGLGAEPVLLSAEQHDAAVALTSHVPQLVGGSLLAQASARDAWLARGPSFEGATRAVSVNAAMWRDVFVTNSDAISEALAVVLGDLQAVREGLLREPADVEPALELLARAARARQH